MSDQLSMFGPVGAYGHTATPEPEPQPAGAASRDDAYRAIRSRLTPMQRRLVALYLRAQREGIRTQAGITLRTLTDMEAAKLLGVERSTINGRRNELMEMGYVEAASKRRCCVTKNPVMAWRAVPQLEL